MLLKITMAVLLAVHGGCWRDLPQLEADSKEKSLEDYDCSDGPCDFDQNDIVKRKGNWMTSNLYEDKPNFHSTKTTPCSCGAQFQWQEIGKEFFPSFIPTYLCSKKSCSPHLQCYQKHYEVQVLKRKGSDGKHPFHSKVANSQLPPDKLRNLWISETFVVPVGCECGA